MTGIQQSALGEPGVAVSSFGAQAFWNPGTAVDPVTGASTTSAVFSGSTLTGSDPFYAGTPLIAGPSGDLTIVTTFVSLDAGIDPVNAPPTAVIQAQRTTGFAMTQGATETLTAVVEDLDAAALPDGAPIRFTWDRGAFLDAGSALAPSFAPFFAGLFISSTPNDKTSTTALTASYGYFLTGSLVINAAKELIVPSYVDPFPTTWVPAVVVQITSTATLDYPLPDGGVVPTDIGASSFADGLSHPRSARTWRRR